MIFIPATPETSPGSLRDGHRLEKRSSGTGGPNGALLAGGPDEVAGKSTQREALRYFTSYDSGWITRHCHTKTSAPIELLQRQPLSSAI